ncbi:zf-HC2 domain-containing protein [Rhodocaloribacter litoris]|uniref:anti-sigma factor family protein n=1 Tax=Rhodocaloribacter litoris TaxID=2558931 RepID=UPI001423352B|nr:zf-HC2 domain-containing protein [Rhodocaloribacter litoris]QXD16381.1 zf-HC2 domain-containing protein [Rhodocaloribacter litoris]
MRKVLHLLQQMIGRTPSCRKVNEFLADYLDGTLDPQTKARFDAHLDACPKCKRYLEQYLQTVELVKTNGTVEPPPELVEHTLAFLRRQLERPS